MRRAVPILCATALFLSAAAVFIGGRTVLPDLAAIAIPAAEDIPAAPAAPAEAPLVQRRSPVASRLVAPKVVAPPQIDPEKLEWTSPRAPLGELGLAQPPKRTRMGNKWDGSTLYGPVAIESAVVASMGLKVAIAGTESIPLPEFCDFGGVRWRCGVSARTAFRLWLRGRALTCDFPSGATELELTAAPCRLGKQDAGAWLVSNGWARAAPGGPYAAAQKSAEADKKGIFGPPPDLSGLAPMPAAIASTPPADQPVLSE